MIEVRRKDYPAIRGQHRSFPARYECRYFNNGQEIAKYTSIDDTLRVRSELISHNKRKSTYENAITGKYGEVYQYLFAMLKVDENSSIYEYMYA